MELLILNFRQALKYIGRHKMQTMAIVGIISVALAALTLSGSVLWYNTHKESHLPDYRNIYMVQVADPTGWIPYSYDVNDSITCHIRDRAPADAKVGTLMYKHVELKGVNDTIVRNSTVGVNADYFNAMQHHFVSGGPVRKAGDIVLTESSAHRLFGSADVVGKVVEVTFLNEDDRKDTYRISGVMRVDEESDVENRTKAYIYYDIVPVPAKDGRYYGYNAQIYVRTDNPDAMQNVLDETLQAFKTSYYNNDYEGIKLVPLRMAELLRVNGSYWQSAFYPTVFMLLSSLLLVSALFSYLALLNTSAGSRWTDYRLRLCLGGGKTDTLRRICAEVVVVFLAVGVISFLLVVWLSPVCFPKMDMPMSGVLLMFGCLFSGLLLFVLLMCFVPVALQNYSYRKSLSGAPQGKVSPLNYPLIVGQIAVSALLLFLVWQGGRQLHYLCNDALRLDIENVYRVDSKSSKYDIWTPELAQEIENSSPAVVACVFNNPIFNRHGSVAYCVDGFEQNITCLKLSRATMQLFGMQPKLFNTTSEPLLWDDNQVLLSSNAAEYYGVTAENPYLHITTRNEVVGTLDICTRSLLKEPELMCYMPDMNSDIGSVIYFRVEPGRDKEAIAAVEEVYRRRGFGKGVDNGDISIEPFSEMILETYKEEQHYLKLYSALSVAGIFIAVFGLLVIITADLQRQRRTLAVRRIFGAKFKVCFLGVLKTYVAFTAIGCIIAVSVGYNLMEMWLSIYKEHIELGWVQAAVIVAGIVLVVTLLVHSKVRSCFKELPSQVINN